MPSGRDLQTPYATAVGRAFSILECLDNARRAMNISDISRKLRIPKSSAHVLMVTLERMGYIERTEDRSYRIGFKTYALGHKMTRSMSVAQVAAPHMNQLAEESGLCVHLAVLDRDQGVIIQKAEPAGGRHFDTYIGRRIDLHCTALGKVILAFDYTAGVRHILEKPVFARYTHSTITTSEALRQQVSTIRKQGYAIDDEEEELGSRCAGVPVLQAGRFVAALSASGTVDELPETRIVRLTKRLAETAAAIAKEDLQPPAV
jgi:DNA-binding IclR family transcriptional regulator